MATLNSLYTPKSIPATRLTAGDFSQLWLVDDQRAALDALFRIAQKLEPTALFPDSPEELAHLITGVLVVAIDECKKRSLRLRDAQNYRMVLPILLDLLENVSLYPDSGLPCF